ncbi:hypothetical protein QQF64_001330 [Cirrhinus molitorella]|uniref:Uncharacterized protein n=1 Tax=Cirrhinus molitorella TaxID=172907 RepID=A0ABR3NZR4_9TELE
MLLPLLHLKPHHLDWIQLRTQKAKPEVEFCAFVMDLLFSGFELVFIIIAFTIMCLFGLAAVYTHNTDHQDDYIQTEQKIMRPKKHSKKIQRVVTKTNQELP